MQNVGVMVFTLTQRTKASEVVQLQYTVRVINSFCEKAAKEGKTTWDQEFRFYSVVDYSETLLRFTVAHRILWRGGCGD